MLHRAASNAYSWWWASHIRTKQSKWLEQSLEDMEIKVNSMLGIIEDEGDSFAKRAEMYYKRRPELISHVEESYRAYRALAERYEKISKELQSANRTIATVFPDQVPLDLDDEDEEFFKQNSPSKRFLAAQVTSEGSEIPAPPVLKKELRSTTMVPLRRGQVPKLKRIPTSAVKLAAPSSGLTKTEAIDEVDKLLKEILALQTEKEFVRSSYERGYQKYFDFENQIAEKQKRVCTLQDEFRVGGVLEDNEARTLMASTALKSCQESLSKLRQKQDRSIEEAISESKRIKEAQEKFAAIRNKFESAEDKLKHPDRDRSSFELKTLDQEIEIMLQEKEDTESLQEMISEELQMEASSPLTILQVAERIDGLVSRVVNLEISVSSQDALVKRLRSEADELHLQVNTLEDDNLMLKHGSEETNNKVKQLEEELLRVKKLVKSIAGQNTNLKSHFTEASCNVTHLSEKLETVRMEIENDTDSEFSPAAAAKEDEAESNGAEESLPEMKPDDLNSQKPEERDYTRTTSILDAITEESEEEPNWRQLYLHGLDDREKLLLDEYTAVLRNYKDVKNKLQDVEQRNRDDFYDLATQIRELKRDLASRDTEIQSLQQRMSVSDKIMDENLDQEPKETPKESSQSKPSSRMEKKIRSDINEILEENMEFWLRFSTSFHQIQKYQTSVQDLKADLEGRTHPGFDARPIYKHLREIQTELTLWLENNAVLKDEVQGRNSSLCNIEDEIARISKAEDGEKEVELDDCQAAKLQGEILYMKQENSKVCNELKSGFERVRELKQEVERIMAKLEVEIEGTQGQNFAAGSRSGRGRIPLRSFLFGVKLKNKKQSKAASMFSCITPALQKQNSYTMAPAPIQPESPKQTP